MTTPGSHFQSLGGGHFRVPGVRVNPVTGRYITSTSSKGRADGSRKNGGDSSAGKGASRG